MISRTTKRFWKLYDALPADVQERADKACELFAANPSHNSLQFKRVQSRRMIYSARVDQSYRGLGELKGDTMNWFWIGPHDLYDRLLNDL